MTWLAALRGAPVRLHGYIQFLSGLVSSYKSIIETCSLEPSHKNGQQMTIENCLMTMICSNWIKTSSAARGIRYACIRYIRTWYHLCCTHAFCCTIPTTQVCLSHSTLAIAPKWQHGSGSSCKHCGCMLRSRHCITDRAWIGGIMHGPRLHANKANKAGMYRIMV